MTWNHHGWLAGYVLPAALGAGLAWVGLARSSVGKGRLLGSWRSAGLTFLVLALTGAVGVAAGLALPHLAKLPPAAAGLATGVTTMPRKRPDDTTQPYVKYMTLGLAWFRERLDYRMQLDARTWSDRFLEGFEKTTHLRVFVHELKNYLLDRHPTRVKAIVGLFEEADRAMVHALEVQTRTDEACGDVRSGWMRKPTDEEIYQCRSALGEAFNRCGDLLLFAYVHGRRTEQPELETLRVKSLSDDAFHSSPLPRQRRRFGLRRTSSMRSDTASTERR
ncbi:hypothetical protein NGF19_15060 [Streptomyces sp. RY43-2]|uniref:Uncharacterized protein n=1 Tax=Streptomyces macrolidinus TaxID=2952607 RepID=A0ABT0ZEV6_9ACTN|nr:hypothetical protein [Streptomyces macrolidinus]MCN9242092.1 hypothetical protein [Streptomyces macrolidinus]